MIVLSLLNALRKLNNCKSHGEVIVKINLTIAN